MKFYNPAPFIILIIIIIIGCQKKDDLPPILTLNGEDTLYVVLNSEYDDPGAVATDETDGNITSNVYTGSIVNVDEIGEYTVIYKVVDQAGNEAKPLTRWIFVYNQGYIYSGYYSLKETQVYPESITCQYEIATNVDSTINFGLIFSSFACDYGEMVFAQVSDTTIVLPYQVLADSLISFSIQGNGYINDSLIYINYTLTKNNTTELWNTTFERLK
jgi:hypothetical protein